MCRYQVAFYRGRKKGKGIMPSVFRFLDSVTRHLTKGPYSHCEIVEKLPDGTYKCFSSSYRDGGVRSKILSLNQESWDFVSADFVRLETLQKVENSTVGQSYDLLGAMGLVFLTPQSQKRWFCSELVAEVIGLPESWRYTPNTLYSVCKRLEQGND